MNCREFIIEFEDRANLSEAATLHLTVCAECRKTSDRQTRIWLAIDELPKVDAPKTFDFSVKARIANAKPSDFQPRWLPILRYVLPLSVVVLVFGLLAFNTSFFFGDVSVPPVAENVLPKSTTTESSTNTATILESYAANIQGPILVEDETRFSAGNRNVKQFENQPKAQFVAVSTIRRVSNRERRANRRDASDDVRSADSAFTEAKTLVVERLNPNRKIELLPDAEAPNAMTAEKIWSRIGVEIVSESGGHKVKTVAPKSSAELSGIKVGDVIEAIDGKKLSAAPIRVSTFEGKTLTVVRGAEKVEINLQNK